MKIFDQLTNFGGGITKETDGILREWEDSSANRIRFLGLHDCNLECPKNKVSFSFK